MSNEAFTQLVDAHQAPLYRFALSLARRESDALRDYAGVYRVTPEQKIGFVVEGDRLALKNAGGRTTPLDALSSTEFTGPNRDAHYTFARDAAGHAERVLVHQRLAPERFAARVDEPLEDPEKPVATVATDILEKYVGDYELAPNFILTVRRDGDSLAAQATGQPEFNLIAESSVRFRVKQLPAAIEFKTDADGAATSLVLFQNGREVPGKKIK